jgi:hypothetical protein
MQEKSINEMNAAELRAGINEHFAQQQAALDPLPLPAAANRAALTPAQQETLFDNWCADILTRAAQTWTPAEIGAIRAATARVLRTM